MRVRARQADRGSAPLSVEPYLGQLLVTPGKAYEVHAVAAFQGVMLLQVIDDLSYPGWRPAWLFDVVDSTIPKDWICSTFNDDPALVLGPPFIALSQEAYSAMVELDSTQVEKFWSRVDGIEDDRLKED